MTEARYFHCNDTRRAPWADTADRPLPADVPRSVTCELARNHDGAHADHLDYLGLEDGDVWAYWNEADHVTYAVMPPCQVADRTLPGIRQDPCHLYAGHPPGHSWDFVDMLHD
ncbi:hypothetical protein [Streptomyces sp. NPDC060198]|uniref:hypothetical protein n=1 Tax=Streptomyces sp. NPDC060198 TaxID=3347070 RepID=UPI003650789F